MLNVDPNSLKQAMADPQYQFKSQHFRFTSPENQPGMPVIQRFRSMLTSDPAHMMPNEQGAAVSVVQLALMKIHSIGSEAFGPANHSEFGLRRYGPITQSLILKLKNQHKIVNYLQQIDPIIGKKTIRALDFILSKHGH
jgi:hypothetical protein